MTCFRACHNSGKISSNMSELVHNHLRGLSNKFDRYFPADHKCSKTLVPIKKCSPSSSGVSADIEETSIFSTNYKKEIMSPACRHPGKTLITDLGTVTIRLIPILLF